LIGKILVGYDGSEAAQHAFRHALEMARRYEARLVVASVVRVPESGLLTEVEGVVDVAEVQMEPVFAELRTRAGEAGVPLETRLVVGHPAEQLVHLAQVEGVDLIILGSRGLSGVKRWMLGSVSERVLRYAHCPVTIIR
jgi:nucleotide-binding universal stress UspA family protein